MPREFSRHQRLGNQVLRTLNELLRAEVKDPRVEGVSLTSVDLSRDLSVARVYFGLLDPEADPAPALEGLPELRFLHDDSAAEGVRLTELIDKAVAADE